MHSPMSVLRYVLAGQLPTHSPLLSAEPLEHATQSVEFLPVHWPHELLQLLHMLPRVTVGPDTTEAVDACENEAWPPCSAGLFKAWISGPLLALVPGLMTVSRMEERSS